MEGVLGFLAFAGGAGLMFFVFFWISQKFFGVHYYRRGQGHQLQSDLDRISRYVDQMRTKNPELYRRKYIG